MKYVLRIKSNKDNQINLNETNNVIYEYANKYAYMNTQRRE